MNKKIFAFGVLSVLGLVCAVSAGWCADKLDEGVRQALSQKFTGDYPELTKKRIIRALVPYSKTFYFLDGATERGATYELLKEFEKFVNDELKTKHLKVHVVIVPTSRDKLLASLIEGRGDIAAGNLTITKGRREKVDFSDPLGKGVNEIVITGPSGGNIKSLSDLSGKVVHVRRSSSYFESLTRLNKKIAAEGKKQME